MENPSQVREFKAKNGYEYGLMYLPSGIFNILPRILLLLPDKETKKLNSEYADYIDYDGYKFCYYIRKCKTKAETEDLIQVVEALFNIKWIETDIIKFYIRLLELKIDPEALEMFMNETQKVKGEKVGNIA